MLDDPRFQLHIDFEPLELSSLWACSVRSRYERTRFRDEVDLVLCDVYVAKSAVPNVFVFMEHFADFLVVLFVKTKFHVVGMNAFISIVYCSLSGVSKMFVNYIDVAS